MKRKRVVALKRNARERVIVKRMRADGVRIGNGAQLNLRAGKNSID